MKLEHTQNLLSVLTIVPAFLIGGYLLSSSQIASTQNQIHQASQVANFANQVQPITYTLEDYTFNPSLPHLLPSDFGYDLTKPELTNAYFEDSTGKLIGNTLSGTYKHTILGE